MPIEKIKNKKFVFGVVERLVSCTRTRNVFDLERYHSTAIKPSIIHVWHLKAVIDFVWLNDEWQCSKSYGSGCRMTNVYDEHESAIFELGKMIVGTTFDGPRLRAIGQTTNFYL